MSSAPHDDLAFLGLGALGRLLRRRALSSLELTEAFFRRIEALDGRLGSYRRLMHDSALAEARAADAAFARGEDRGPLQGLPLAVKDLCDTAGVVTAGGMAFLADRVPERDSTVVARLRQAGAVLLGKLTMTEGAMSQHHGLPAPVNPWSREDLPLWYGSSSSGSGVATAAGLCLAAIGSDTGGSIRFPALANGVTGIKPTWGRVSRAGIMALAPSLDHIGPLSRGIEASAAVLQAIAGHDGADPTSLTESVPDYLASLGQGLAGVRLGYDPVACSRGVQPEVVAAVEQGIAGLTAAGAELREIRLPEDHGAIGGWIELCCAETALVHRALYPRHGAAYGSALKLLVETGRSMTAEAYAKAHLARLDYRGAMTALFGGIDLLITPLMAVPVPLAVEVEKAEPSVELYRGMLAFSAPAPLTGFPALQLPAGFDSRGAPQGFQLTAAPLAEALLFRAGAAWQQATDWHEKRPPLA